MKPRIDLEIKFTAVCFVDCSQERAFRRFIPSSQMILEIGSFRQSIANKLTGDGWTCDAEGGWLCPEHSSLATRPSSLAKEAA